MRAVKSVILAALCVLLGSTSVDLDAFVVSYDQTAQNPTDIFNEIDQFVDRAGFTLEGKIEELLPEQKVVVSRRKGIPYEGGIFLKLVQYESGSIELEGARLRGGCSKSIEIEELTALKGAVEQHLSDKFGANIKLVRRDAQAP